MTSISFPIIKIQHSNGYRIILGLYYFALLLFLLVSSIIIAGYKLPMIVKIMGVVGMISYIILNVVISIRKELLKEYIRIGHIEIHSDKFVCCIGENEIKYDFENIYDIKICLSDYDKRPQGSRGLTLSDGTGNYIKFRDYHKNNYYFRLYVPSARLSEQGTNFIKMNNFNMRII